MITISVNLEEMTCPNCGGLYAIAADYKKEAAVLGNFKQVWTCPYCKQSRGFGLSEADKLKEKIAELERSVARTEECKRYAEQEAEHFRKSRDGLKGVLAKERKRVGSGVCPCCNRSFTNLRRHMATKHAEHAVAKIGD